MGCTTLKFAFGVAADLSAARDQLPSAMAALTSIASTDPMCLSRWHAVPRTCGLEEYNLRALEPGLLDQAGRDACLGRGVDSSCRRSGLSTCLVLMREAQRVGARIDRRIQSAFSWTDTPSSPPARRSMVYCLYSISASDPPSHCQPWYVVTRMLRHAVLPKADDFPSSSDNAHLAPFGALAWSERTVTARPVFVLPHTRPENAPEPWFPIIWPSLLMHVAHTVEGKRRRRRGRASCAGVRLRAWPPVHASSSQSDTGTKHYWNWNQPGEQHRGRDGIAPRFRAL